MRKLAFLVSALAIMTTVPAFAGSSTYTDNQGSWHSTMCQAPVAPEIAAHNPEAPADDLNARLAQQQTYANTVGDYMRCISAEAQHDADAASKLIIKAAEGDIQKAQASAAANAAALSRDPAYNKK